MNTEDQIMLVRNIYLKCRERYYDHDFRYMLAALSGRDPEYYCARQEYIHAIMNAAENAILREEISRAMRYVICFKCAMAALEKRMYGDCHRYWEYLKVRAKK